MKVGITGHRPDKIDGDYTCTSPRWDALYYWFHGQFEELAPDEVVSGLALGVDQLAVECAMDMGIRVTAAIPFEGQQARWPPKSRADYAAMLMRVTDTGGRIVVVSPGGYAAWKLHARNQWIVNGVDRMLAVWDGTSGGTGECVKYAAAQRKPVIRLDPATLIQPTLFAS